MGNRQGFLKIVLKDKQKHLQIWSRLVISVIFISVIPLLSVAKPKPTENPILLKALPPFKVDKGRVLYHRFCSYCHGKTGKGDGPNSFNLSPKPADLSGIQTYSSDKIKAIETVLKKGGKVLGKSVEMPAFENTLGQHQINDVIRFLQHSLNQ